MSDIKMLIESAKYAQLNQSDAASMKVLLENTDRELQSLVNEGTLTGDVAQFTPILLPLVRRVYPNLIANELLGVQPMSMPTGYVYSLVNQYLGTGNNKATAAKPAKLYVLAGLGQILKKVMYCWWYEEGVVLLYVEGEKSSSYWCSCSR